jgi:hypothetical protein
MALVGSAISFVAIATLYIVPRAAVAQTDNAPLELHRLSGPVTIDGVPNEAAWQAIPPLPLTMYTPVFRGKPTQRTEIRVAYDDEYLYAAGWFYDTDASSIRVNSLYRDRWNGDDAFAIYVDAFNDKKNAKWFGTTPGGIRFDQLISDDGATINSDWDTFWSAATTITAEGWFAEVRIPFSSLGFRSDASGKAIMGLTVTRLISRSDERVTFPEIDSRFDFRRPSVAREIVLRGVHPRTPLYLTPYALTGLSRRALEQAPPGPVGFRNENSMSRQAGVDVRYPLSGKLTLDLTANTDFAQVEADDQVVNLDRFPLYFPERRRFFQEGSGIFDFNSTGGLRLFNSRRIGLTSDLTPVPVLGGARLVGRMGGWDVGALEMETKAQDTFPAENFGVARLRHSVLNPYSTVGFMATTYAGGSRRNDAFGADGVFRIRGDQYLTLKLAGTTDNADSTGSTLADHSLVDFRIDRRVERGLQYNLSMSRAGRDYRPELGFLPRTDFTIANVGGNYFIFTDSNRYFRRVYPGALAFHTFRNSDRALESAQWAVWVEWDTKDGGGGWVEPKVFHENVASAFTIAGKTGIPAGAYTFSDLQLVYDMGTGSPLRTNVDFRAGSYFDGQRVQLITSPTWNVSPHLEFGTDYQYTRLRFPVRDQGVDINVVRLRIRSALDARASGNAFIQYNSTTNRLDFNVRLRYAFAEGTDLWLVYNEGLDTDRAPDAVGAIAPLSLSRALILKYTHTFGF